MIARPLAPGSGFQRLAKHLDEGAHAGGLQAPARGDCPDGHRGQAPVGQHPLEQALLHEGGRIALRQADQPQAVRGIRLTPAYAKSKKIALANNRVKSFRVVLSDGASFDFEVSPDLPGDLYDQYASFAFDGVHEITWASVEVTEVYPGGQYTDTCISEIALF